MSTNSTIGITQDGKNVRGIYCHWDGYISHNGVLLDCFYNNAESVENLIKGFNYVSSLAPVVDRERAAKVANNRDKEKVDSVLYAALGIYTRGEIEGKEDEHIECSLEEFWQQAYAYVFDVRTNKWMVVGGIYDDWMPLHKAILYEAAFNKDNFRFEASNCFNVLDFPKTKVPAYEYALAERNYMIYYRYLSKLKAEIEKHRDKFSYESYYALAKEKYRKYKDKKGVMIATIKGVSKYGDLECEMRLDGEDLSNYNNILGMPELVLCTSTKMPSQHSGFHKENDYKGQMVLTNPSLLKPYLLYEGKELKLPKNKLK